MQNNDSHGWMIMTWMTMANPLLESASLAQPCGPPAGSLVQGRLEGRSGSVKLTCESQLRLAA